MSTEAVLTFGWKDDPGSDFAAAKLHREADISGREYEKTLAGLLENMGKPVVIDGLDRLIRRRIGEIANIRKFVGALVRISDTDSSLGPVVCNIDAFAYAFLKGADNFDFLMPEKKESAGPFRTVFPKWEEEMGRLERFEQFGDPLPDEAGKDYLSLRKRITPATAGNERRLLATLLVNGPSTVEEISRELDIGPVRSRGITGMFEEIGVTEETRDGKHVISEQALPRVLFCLRGKMGLDFFNLLNK